MKYPGLVPGKALKPGLCGGTDERFRLGSIAPELIGFHA
jgi:hypothetical protein